MNEGFNSDRCEHRCSCGQLVAIRTPSGVEIKCKRCKRVFEIPVVEEFSSGSNI